MQLSKELLEDLYNRERLSMSQIAQRLGCSQSNVVYWMRQYDMPRRDRSEAVYCWYNPDGDPFAIGDLETDAARELFCLAIGLYIGEGKKKTHGEVAIANTDHQVIRVFIRFLREICGVDQSSLVAGINVFDDVDLEETRRYWEEVTGLPRSQFQKPTVRPSRGGTYRGKSRYGTVTVGVYSTKLHQIVQRWCSDFLNQYDR